MAKLLSHSQTLLLMMGSKTPRLKQQMVPFETHFILWLHLIWGDQVLLPNLFNLNYGKNDQFLLLPKVVRSQKYGGSERESQCGVDFIW